MGWHSAHAVNAHAHGTVAGHRSPVPPTSRCLLSSPGLRCLRLDVRLNHILHTVDGIVWGASKRGLILRSGQRSGIFWQRRSLPIPSSTALHSPQRTLLRMWMLVHVQMQVFMLKGFGTCIRARARACTCARTRTRARTNTRTLWTLWR